MDIVQNGVVKMEWDKKGFYYKNKKFFFAVTEYDTEDMGTLIVVFTPHAAFLWVYEDDDETVVSWELGDFMRWATKEGVGEGFPHNAYTYDNYIEVANSEGVNMEIAESWGLAEFAEDIKARLEDLAPYSAATEMEL